MQADASRAPIVITHEGGMKFAAQVRSHRVIIDQPERAGGGDAGPMPIELLGASLGSCVALYVQQFCQSRDLPCEGMRVEVQQYGAANPNRIAEFVLRIVLPSELSEHQEEMLERAAQSCPAHHTLTQGAKVTVHVEMGERIVC